MTGRRPLAVAFDVNETLMSLRPLRDRLTAAGADPELLDLWFARVLRDGFALVSAGDYLPFAQVAESALRSVGPELDEAAVAEVLAGFGELEPYPDVEPALRLLSQAKVPALTLTNGSAANAEQLLGRAHLTASIKQVLSVDAVRSWKPAAEPYRYAAAQAGVPADRLALVAVHSWDIHGAARAGLTTGWCGRLEGRPVRAFVAADVTATTLVDVVRGLLALG